MSQAPASSPAPAAYTPLRAGLHWLIAASVIGALATGLILGRPGYALLPLHMGLGLIAGLAGLARLWLRLRQGAPRSNRAAQAVHWLLALLPIVQMASGIALVALAGAVPAMVAGRVLTAQDFAALPPSGPHFGIGMAILLLASGHVAMALWHHVVRRDGLIARMLPRRGAGGATRA